MRRAIPFLIQGSNIVLVVDGQSYTISKDTHVSFTKIMDAIKAKDWDTVAELVDTRKAIVNFGSGHVTINNDQVLWKGQPFHNALATRMVQMFSEGFPVEPMVNFMENLMQNPSMRSVDQLYGFLEKNKLPITEDGYFLAYKKVRKDYKDIYSGTVDNSVGQKPKMDRNQVDDNPESTCSKGLHFCSLEYLNGFGSVTDPVMIVKINPRDVVSIPKDANGSKGRACEYEVVAQVDGDPAVAFASIVDKTYSKPAKDTGCKGDGCKGDCSCSGTTQPAWPFPTSSGAELYSCVRVHGGQVEWSNCDLAHARHHVEQNRRQKKAKLMIVDSKGNQVS